jgi:hypothetical protein
MFHVPIAGEGQANPMNSSKIACSLSITHVFAFTLINSSSLSCSLDFDTRYLLVVDRRGGRQRGALLVLWYDCGDRPAPATGHGQVEI